jgi:hypothetical protein
LGESNSVPNVASMNTKPLQSARYLASRDGRILWLQADDIGFSAYAEKAPAFWAFYWRLVSTSVRVRAW